MIDPIRLRIHEPNGLNWLAKGPMLARPWRASSVGLDRDDPLAALEAFGGEELRLDVGRAGGRLFLNNVSLGADASLVHHELKLFDLGARQKLTEGRLHLYSAGGLLPTAWDERVGETFELEGPRGLQAAIDGEPTELETPLRLRVQPRSLRVLVPPGR
jgi:hypothetical protein